MIRRLEAADRDGWLPLWRGYLRFYRARLPDEVGRRAFDRLIGADSDMAGFVAELDGRPRGFVNLVVHASTWAPAGVCYLQDLYVEPGARGNGTGRGLIEAAYAFADARGLTDVYWHTQEFNADARALYDTLAERTSFIQYRRR